MRMILAGLILTLCGTATAANAQDVIRYEEVGQEAFFDAWGERVDPERSDLSQSIYVLRMPDNVRQYPGTAVFSASLIRIDNDDVAADVTFPMYPLDVDGADLMPGEVRFGQKFVVYGMNDEDKASMTSFVEWIMAMPPVGLPAYDLSVGFNVRNCIMPGTEPVKSTSLGMYMRTRDDQAFVELPMAMLLGSNPAADAIMLKECVLDENGEPTLE